MQLAVSVPVEIRHVLRDVDAEHVEVQMCVSSDEWVVGPIHDLDPEIADHFPLICLESPAESEVARLRADGKHVAPVDESSPLHAGEPEDEAEEFAAVIECA